MTLKLFGLKNGIDVMKFMLKQQMRMEYIKV